MKGAKMINYGTKLREIRTSFQLNQIDFAEKLGMKQNTYAMIENNTNGCNTRLLEKLFTDHKVNPCWFFLDEGEMFKVDEQPTPLAITPLTPFHLIRVISTLEKVILSYRERLQGEHRLNEEQVNLIIDNYAGEATDFNTRHTEVKIMYNNEFTYRLTRP